MKWAISAIALLFTGVRGSFTFKSSLSFHYPTDLLLVLTSKLKNGVMLLNTVRLVLAWINVMAMGMGVIAKALYNVYYL